MSTSVSSNDKKRKRVKKSNRGPVGQGKVYISTNFNNTRITVTDNKGEVVTSCSAGAVNGREFKGARKSTPLAAQKALTDAVGKAVSDFGLRSVTVYIHGANSPAREAALRALSVFVHGNQLKVLELVDTTRFAHNGCRPRKRRRT